MIMFFYILIQNITLVNIIKWYIDFENYKIFIFIFNINNNIKLNVIYHMNFNNHT